MIAQHTAALAKRKRSIPARLLSLARQIETQRWHVAELEYEPGRGAVRIVRRLAAIEDAVIALAREFESGQVRP